MYLDEKEGTLHRISFTDKKDLMELKLNGNTFSAAFGLVDDNRSADLLLCAGGQLKVMNLNGSLLFENKAPEGISQISHYSDQHRSLLYGLDEEKAELWLYDMNSKGEQSYGASALPLLMDLYKDKKLYLVFPEGEQLKCLSY